jgi:purine nucleosidase
MHKVIIDTDLGVDDAHAVLMALLSPEIHIEGFTTVFGNTDVHYCAQNTLYVLEMVGRTEIPVRQGAGSRLLGMGNGGLSGKLVHGEKGLGDFELPPLKTSLAEGNAIQWLIETVLANPGEIEVLALGPLTNVALATLTEPEWIKAVKRVIFMGGVITGPGNVLPLSTANIYNDAEAAQIVFRGGYPIVMVGQDVTRSARLTPTHKRQMRAADTEVTRFLEKVTRFYEDFYLSANPGLKDKGHPIHDMLVMAYLLQPTLFKTEKLHVTVETEGLVTRGQTVPDWRSFSPHEPQMDVCLEVDEEALFELYLDIITREETPQRHPAR